MIPPLVLVGPTASGKTSVALALAPAFGAEVVCADSMTVYRGMDVGTAKPPAAARAVVPHHLLDLVPPLHRFTVAEFQAAARAALDAIRARGRRPMVVGGSGLYVRATIDPLRFPPHDPAVRARLERLDPEERALRLKRADPRASEWIDPRNHRRVVRALEVIELTGRPFSSFRDDWERLTPVPAAGLEVSPEELGRRIDGRLRAMLDDGLLGEVRSLLADGYRDAITASQAIGYAQAVAHLDGAITGSEMLEEAARATRRLARRQMQWFRRDPRVRWFPADDIGHATAQIRAYWGGGSVG